MRVFIAGLFHETHTFLGGLTSREDFAWLRGEEMSRARGDASPLDGALQVAEECRWKLAFGLDARAMPSATVEDSVVEEWWRECESALRAARKDGIDGVYSVLHGAMCSETLRDVEGEILRRTREIIGPETPIGGVTDLHANFSPLMADNSNALVTYRENPHTDARDRAVHAAQLLDKIMREKPRATTHFAQVPLLWPPTGTGTAGAPMQTLEKLARDIESRDTRVLAASVHAGYSFADTRDSGVSFTIIATAPREDIEPHLQELCDAAMQEKERGNVIEEPLENVMPRIVARRRELDASGKRGPIILVEPSDNIGGGAPGDGAMLLKTLLDHDIVNAAVVINDAEVAAQLFDSEIGASTRIKLGDKICGLCGGALELEVETVSRSDGRFTLEDKNSHLAAMLGENIRMGNCVVARARGNGNADVLVLITTNQTPPFDLGQLRSQGIVPEELDFVGVKAAVAHRRAYDPIAADSFTIGTPGPCASDLKSFPFRHLRRPIYPLDEL